MGRMHGGDIYTSPAVLDFSVNLNPGGMPPVLKQAVLASEHAWEVYPDVKQRRLRQAAAAYYGREGIPVSAESFLFGNGASDLLQAFMLGQKPESVLIPVPTFTEYEQAAKMAGARVIRLPFSESAGFSYEEAGPRLKKALEEYRPDLLVLCNPNNPTGTVLSAESLEYIAGICRETDTFLLADECFGWFLADAGRGSLLSAALRDRELFDHAAVLNSLTKICAMPGLRLGYLVTQSEAVLEHTADHMQPWPVNACAEAAGIAAFEEYLAEGAKKAAELAAREREYLSEGLRSLGFTLVPSETDFLLFHGRDDGTDLKEACLSRGILLRSCGDFPGLGKNWYRVCARRREDNSLLLKALGDICGG